MKMNSLANVVTLDCSFSYLGFVEPPDVGNWFSSYEYKSPDPDSNVDFEDSAFRDCESENDEETEGEEETNLIRTRVGDEVVAGDKLLISNTSFDDKHIEDLSLGKVWFLLNLPL